MRQKTLQKTSINYYRRFNNNIQLQLNYQSNSLQAANDAIVNKLRISLEAKEGS